MQVLAWDETSRFCSCCGEKTTAHDSECVKQCEQCGHTQYPRLAPAMIVGVVRDGKLLLAQSPRFKGVFHSILAGFVEPGETAEECVRREVFEEVGIRVRDIRYFGSQSWPFPHSFMLGFTASWEAGEINPDPDEIAHADWYAPDEMPATPSEVSISGRIIRWFRESYGQK
jgi:NAD+ diphosphatase